METLIMLFFHIAHLFLFIGGLALCIFNLAMTEKQATKKDYTPDQKKKYVLAWALLALFCLYLTIKELTQML